MSKALLIVDIDDKHSNGIDELRVDIRINCYGEEIEYFKNQCLKPLPPKKEEIDIKETISTPYSKGVIILEKVIEKARQQGYNICLDEILGDEEYDE